MIPFSISEKMGDHHQAAWAVSTHVPHLILAAARGVNESNADGLFSFHAGGVNILLADASVRHLSSSTDLQTLRSLVTRAGHD